MALDLSRLESAYGFVPSFHDARVLDVELGGRTLRITLYLYESPAEGRWKQDWDRDLHCVATLEYSGVTKAELFFNDNWLYSVRFAEEAGGVVAELVDANSGRTGRILAEDVRIAELIYPERPFVHPPSEDASVDRENLRTVRVRLA